MDSHEVDASSYEETMNTPAVNPFESASGSRERSAPGSDPGSSATRSAPVGGTGPSGSGFQVALAETAPGMGRLGDYEIQGLLGQGGMGQVFSARDPRLERTVAVKTLRPEFAAVDSMAERFVREARSAAALAHPNIVQVYAAGVDGTTPYFAMEYVEGQSLKEAIEGGPLIPSQALDYCIQAAKGLKAAADKNIIHRDIKPGNLMLDNHGVVKIADFGLAKNVETDLGLTQTGALIGSPYYMSPEQSAGERATFKSDMYSLGATLWHLLAGTPPFEAKTPASVMLKHATEQLPRLGHIELMGGGEARKVIAKMMAKRPEDRHASYAELIEDLERLLLAEKMSAAGLSAASPKKGRVKGWLKVAGFFLAAMVVGSVLTQNSLRKQGLLKTPEQAEKGPVPAAFADRSGIEGALASLPGMSASEARGLANGGLEHLERLGGIADALERSNGSTPLSEGLRSAGTRLEQSALDFIGRVAEGEKIDFPLGGQTYRVVRIHDGRIVFRALPDGEKFGVAPGDLSPAGALAIMAATAGPSPEPNDAAALALLAGAYGLPSPAEVERRALASMGGPEGQKMLAALEALNASAGGTRPAHSAAANDQPSASPQRPLARLAAGLGGEEPPALPVRPVRNFLRGAANSENAPPQPELPPAPPENNRTFQSVFGVSATPGAPEAFLSKPGDLELFAAFDHLFSQSPDLAEAAKTDLLSYNFGAVAQSLGRAAQADDRPPVKLKASAAAHGIAAYGEAFNQRLQWLASQVDGGEQPEVFLDGVTYRAVEHRGEWIAFRASIAMDGEPERFEMKFWDLSPEVLFQLLRAGGVNDEAGRIILAFFATIYNLPLEDALLIDFPNPQGARDLKTIMEALVSLQARGGLGGLLERWQAESRSFDQAAQERSETENHPEPQAWNRHPRQQRPGGAQGWGPPPPPDPPNFLPPPPPNGQGAPRGPGQGGPGGRERPDRLGRRR